MNLMTVDGYSAKIEYDADSDHFRGEILGMSGGADFYGANPDELRGDSSDRWMSSWRFDERRESNPVSSSLASSIRGFLQISTKSLL